MQNQAKKLDMQKLLAPLALVILYIVFSIFGTNFLSLDMVKNILESSYYIGFMAFGVTFIIITGGIDLSLGTVMMCAALLGGYTFKQGWPAHRLCCPHDPGRRGVRLYQRQPRCKAPPAAVHRHARHADDGGRSRLAHHQGAVPDLAHRHGGGRRLVQKGVHPRGAVRCEGLPGGRVLAGGLLHHRRAHPAQDPLRALCLCHRLKRGSHPSVRHQGRKLEGRGLHPLRLLHRYVGSVLRCRVYYPSPRARAQVRK